MAWDYKRTVAEVVTDRRTGRCCDRYADTKACDCLENASDYRPEVHGNGVQTVEPVRAVATGNGEPTHKILIRELIKAVGDDPDRPGLKDTPTRVVRSWGELFAGYKTDVKSLFTTFDGEPCDEMVVLRDIPFTSCCEHHMLPFRGTAHVGYVPHNNRVLGLSKMARVVDAFALRLQLQERITRQVAEAIMQHLRPKGVAVVLTAEHQCLACRGVRKPGAVMVTSDMRGVFRKDLRCRAEFLSLVNSRGQ